MLASLTLCLRHKSAHRNAGLVLPNPDDLLFRKRLRFMLWFLSWARTSSNWLKPVGQGQYMLALTALDSASSLKR